MLHIERVNHSHQITLFERRDVSCTAPGICNAERNLLGCCNDALVSARSSTTRTRARYLAVPPCVWGDPAEGLQEPPLLSWDTNLTSIKRANSTYAHTGEMVLIYSFV